MSNRSQLPTSAVVTKVPLPNREGPGAGCVSPFPECSPERRRALWCSLAAVLLATCCATILAAAETEDAAALAEPEITDFDRDHWSYLPLERPELPSVKNEAWVRTPIDRFILASLEAEDLQPSPQADPASLLRRVTFDLTGLPPTPEEIEAFTADHSPEAYGAVVDRLLASSAYGERWAMYWLDLARFAETDGFEHDNLRPEAWRYRDWVIEALNLDVPYNEFVQQQIAGDELDPENPMAAAATGFLLAGPDMPDINLQEERRHNVLNEMTATVGAVFLGLQVGCAQCHNHKYDAISQADFYRLRAVFESADLFGKHEFGRVLQDAEGPVAPSRMMIRGDFRRPGPELEPGFPRIANPWGETIPPSDSGDPASGRRAALAHWLTRPDHPLAMRVIVNRIWQYHFGRGLSATPSDFGVMGEEPTHPELLDWLATELPRLDWSLKRLHRLIVTSAVYCQTSHLASEGSADHDAIGDAQAAAAHWKALLEADPDNELWGRMPRQRLEGEAIRDAMLFAADRLSPRTGGPGVMPPLPQELLSTIRKDHWQESLDEEDHRRRSIYLFVRRNLHYPMFVAFDRPDTNATCPRRDRSTIAPQALVLLNSEFSQSMATALAGVVAEEAGPSDAARVERAYLRTLGRRPTADEKAACCAFLEAQSARLKKEGRDVADLRLPDSPNGNETGRDPYRDAALTDLCLAIFNFNEFIYLD